MENFIPIRNGIKEHLKDGKLPPFDLGVYLFMHLYADWATGVYTGCSSAIALGFGDPRLQQHVQRSLRRLKDRGYISYRDGDGKRGLYPILITKYEARGKTFTDRNSGATVVRRSPERSSSQITICNQSELGQLEDDSSNGRLNGAGTVAGPIQEVQEVQEKDSLYKRARRLPDDWIPKRSHYELAADLVVVMDVELPKFRDHYLSNGKTFIDWDRAFNNWLRKAKEFNSRSYSNGQQRQTATPAAEARTHKRRQNIFSGFTAPNGFTASSSHAAGDHGGECEDDHKRSSSVSMEPGVLRGILPG